MVDVISARVQEAYVGWRQSFFSEKAGNREPVGGQRPNLNAINHQSRRRQNIEKESIKLVSVYCRMYLKYLLIPN